MEEKRKEETQYQNMRKILNKIQHKSLHISRIPDDTKEKFIRIANEQFCGDFGMLIKFMIDGLIDPNTQEIYARLDELEQRLRAIEPLVNREESSEEEDVIKTASGRILRKK